MATSFLKKLEHGMIGKQPVVIVPLGQWREVEAKLEEYEMLRSERFRRSIVAARKQAKQGKLYRMDLNTGKFKKAH